MVEWIQSRMPRSLFGRAALILLTSIATLLVVVAVSFVQRHYADVSRQMTRSMLVELRLLAQSAAAAPDLASARAAAARLGGPLELEVRLPSEPPGADLLAAWDLAGRTIAGTLREGAPETLVVDLSEPRRVAVWLDTPHGPLEVEFARRRVAATNPHQLLVIMGALGLVMTAVSSLFLRNQLRPVRRLAEAATAYGRGRVVPFRPSGALEVRAAGAAFLDMRNRIVRQGQARTAMLAGISHDLRTPLTRLKLGLSLLEDSDGPEVQDLRRDVDDMERMVDAFLAYAKGDAGDPQEATDVAALAQGVVASFVRGGGRARVAAVEGADPGPVPLRPLAVRRALENLVGNALRHGTRADVSLAWGERTLRLTVEDDGPGIPPERREEALRPFVRLDAARNQDRGAASGGGAPGTGLGLAIVADVARAHGGSLRLGRSAALGGLRADLVLAR